MKKFFLLIKNNIQYLCKKALYIAFSISTIASIYEIGIGKIIDKNEKYLKVIVLLLFVFVILFLLSFILITLYYCFRKTFVIFTTDKHSIYLHFGDLFNNEIINNKAQLKNVVINVNRCFDIIVNNELISENTLQGQVIKKLYSEQKYNEKKLKDTINNSLKSCTYQEISKNDKPQGNLKRYPVGTVVKIKDTDTKSYFLLGMSSFNQTLNAQTSKEDFVLSIQRLIEYCDKKSQGFPVLLPLLGSNLSRTGIHNYSDNLNYIISALKINKNLINSDFHIFIKPSDKEKIKFGDI